MDKIILAIRIIQITANSSSTQLTRATKLFYKDYSRLQTLSLLSSEKVGGATHGKKWAGHNFVPIPLALWLMEVARLAGPAH